jgi:threonine/homoserine/homoserine lactone efflux protein
MLGLILQGVGFGFAAGTSPGPLQTFIISVTLSRGWRRGIIITFAPLVTDAPIIFLMTVILNKLPNDVIRGIQIVGGVFVLWLAWSTWQSLRAGVLIGHDSKDNDIEKSHILLRAAAINVLSPGPYIFWSSVTGPVLIEGFRQSIWHGAAFLVSFYGVFLVIMWTMVLAFDRLRRLDERLTRGVLIVSIMILALLGFGLLIQGLEG